MLDAYRLWSYWDMLSLNANAFYFASTTIAGLRATISATPSSNDAAMTPVHVNQTKVHMAELQKHAIVLGANVTSITIAEALNWLNDPSQKLFFQMATALRDIEQTLRKELFLTKLFVLESENVKYF
jgi:hypothetical protein